MSCRDGEGDWRHGDRKRVMNGGEGGGEREQRVMETRDGGRREECEGNLRERE